MSRERDEDVTEKEPVSYDYKVRTANQLTLLDTRTALDLEMLLGQHQHVTTVLGTLKVPSELLRKNPFECLLVIEIISVLSLSYKNHLAKNYKVQILSYPLSSSNLNPNTFWSFKKSKSLSKC